MSLKFHPVMTASDGCGAAPRTVVKSRPCPKPNSVGRVTTSLWFLPAERSTCCVLDAKTNHTRLPPLSALHCAKTRFPHSQTEARKSPFTLATDPRLTGHQAGRTCSELLSPSSGWKMCFQYQQHPTHHRQKGRSKRRAKGDNGVCHCDYFAGTSLQQQQKSQIMHFPSGLLLQLKPQQQQQSKTCTSVLVSCCN